MSEILAYALDHQVPMVEALSHLVMLESPTDDPAAVNAVSAYLAGSFEAFGAQVERLPARGFGDHLRVTWGEGRQQLLLLGHMDTVWPVGECRQRPFQACSDPASGALIGTGPGVFDMKGGLVIGLYALAALRATGLRPAHRLVWLLNSDEEVGSPGSRALIEDEARRSQAVLVLEPCRGETLVVWRKGVGRFELEVQGRASHSGGAHERGISAVEELCHQVLRLEAMTDYGRGTTVNVGVIAGGSRVNVRPALARAAVDLRVLTLEEGERMSAAIRGLRPVNEQARLEVRGGINRPPWPPSAQGDALFERARRVGQALGIELAPSGAGGGSDGNFTAALGVPTLDGLGIAGDDAHALSEWADLGSLPLRAALLAELVLELGR